MGAASAQGVISLSAQKFPEGSKGPQLDVLARQHLWNQGLDYLHGTCASRGELTQLHMHAANSAGSGRAANRHTRPRASLRDSVAGTGHGVGHFLNVHEGPIGISPRLTVSGVLLLLPDTCLCLWLGNAVQTRPRGSAAGLICMRLRELRRAVNSALVPSSP